MKILSAATKTWHGQINKYEKNPVKWMQDKLRTVGKYLLTTCPTMGNDLEYIKSLKIQQYKNKQSD